MIEELQKYDESSYILHNSATTAFLGNDLPTGIGPVGKPSSMNVSYGSC